MVTEQLVYFTGMTRTELPDFGSDTLIPLLYQLPLDGFLFVVIHSFCMYDHESPIRSVYSTLLLFVYMNCMVPHALAYGLHLIGDLN